MFERFTEQARRVIVHAQEEARLLDHDYIGPEHLLLGLNHAGAGAVAELFDSSGISLEAVRNEVARTVGRGRPSPSARIPFTPDAKTAIDLAFRETLQLGTDQIKPEHLLLGLIRVPHGSVPRILVALGTSADQVLSELGISREILEERIALQETEGTSDANLEQE